MSTSSTPRRCSASRRSPTKGTIHNAYVTPDGNYVVAGSIGGKTINVIDAKTEEPAWTVEMDLGIRPMTFNTNPDGSTKWIFAQLTGLNGFAVVDFATHKEIRAHPEPRPAAREDDRAGRIGSVARHGGDRRRQDAGGLQPVEQLSLLVLTARPEAARRRGARRQRRRMGHAHA